jgi:putative FmdB family regulatory protein
MPTYDYKCTKCQRSFAVEQSMRDAPLRKCEKCGGKLEKQLPKSVSLIFKGSGFYATDYKNKGKDRIDRGKAGSKKEGAGSKKEGAGDRGGKD